MWNGTAEKILHVARWLYRLIPTSSPPASVPAHHKQQNSCGQHIVPVSLMASSLESSPPYSVVRSKCLMVNQLLKSHLGRFMILLYSTPCPYSHSFDRQAFQLPKTSSAQSSWVFQAFLYEKLVFGSTWQWMETLKEFSCPVVEINTELMPQEN